MYYFLPENCENSISSPGAEGESSAASFSDIPPSVLLKLNLTVGACCSSASEMESSPDSRSGMTFATSTASRGADSSMLCAAGSRASHLAPLAIVSRTATLETFGPKPSESFATFDQESHFWRTSQRSLFTNTSEPFSGTYPTRGLMLNGELFERPASALLTDDPGFSLWPTPTASDQLRTKLKAEAFLKQKERNAESGHGAGVSSGSLIGAVVIATGYCPAPEFHEWMMGMPIGWSDLRPLEMRKFQQWLASHGRPSNEQ